jgi:tRNA nucleotidyltransferase (CCA-adding enzyme)
MHYLSNFFNFLKNIRPIINDIAQSGGTPYLVGGCVRDLVLKRDLKDFDIEVHGLALEELQNIVEKYGPVRLVGKQFGVLRVDGIDADWSLPRKDSKGRKPMVLIDEHMTIHQAAKRRDVTMNAMALDLQLIADTWVDDADAGSKITQLIIDPCGGLQDMQQRRLRAVDAHLFTQDPLRFFRVMQFVARFEMQPDDELNDVCRNMVLRDTHLDVPLARERVADEIKKLFLKSHKPSRGFVWLKNLGRLGEIFPELDHLVGVKQKPEYHPEGDVFVHTMQVIDAVARYQDYQEGSWGSAEYEKFILSLAALCHDVGKATATRADLTSYGHAEEGVPLAKSLLRRMTNDLRAIDMVLLLVKYHMLPFGFLREKASHRSYKRLAIKISPLLMLRQLGLVALFDAQGRNGKSDEPLNDFYEDFEKFMMHARDAAVAQGPEEPVLLGRHLMDIVQPGPQMGVLLKKAYDIQINEGIRDVEVLKKRVL